jgi:hypothetical protein
LLQFVPPIFFLDTFCLEEHIRVFEHELVMGESPHFFGKDFVSELDSVALEHVQEMAGAEVPD